MRTRTFANDKVIRLLNEHFVCTWSNKYKGVEFPSQMNKMLDEVSGKMFPNGAGGTSITFSTPDGVVLHTVEGYCDADRLVKEIERVLKLKKECLDKNLKLKQGASEKLKQAQPEPGEDFERDLKRLLDGFFED